MNGLRLANYLGLKNAGQRVVTTVVRVIHLGNIQKQKLPLQNVTRE